MIFLTLVKSIYLVLLMVLMRPFIKIKLTQIRPRFGQMVSEMTLIQANILAGNFNKSIFIFYFISNEKTYNLALKEIYNRQYLIIDSQVGYYANKMLLIIFRTRDAIISPITRLITKNSTSNKNSVAHFEIDHENVVKTTPPHLNFLSHEKELGQKFINDLPANKGIVCLSLKEKAYYGNQRIFDNYPMAENEYGNIDDYIQAINKFTEYGFLVIRMGGALESDSIESDNPLFFDYAVFKDRSDFLDLYIADKCSFHFSNQTGYDQLGSAFRKHVYYTSVRAYAYLITQYPFALFLPVSVYSKKEDRSLTFREIFSLENRIYKEKKDYAHCITEMNRLGYYYVKKKPIEIAIYSTEVLNHYLNAESNEYYKNNDLVNKFWNLYFESEMLPFDRRFNRDSIYINPSIDFLRNNEWMLK
jgi:putative glycosyltransferase (TIGR04372 family)